MNTTIQDLKTYLVAHPWKNSMGEVDYILDTLFWEYMEDNFVSTDVLRLQTQKAEKQMGKLSYKEMDSVFDSFFRVCAEYQHLAFIAGAQAGMRLTLELMNKKSAC